MDLLPMVFYAAMTLAVFTAAAAAVWDLVRNK